MYELIIIGLYTLAILIFVPLDKIGKAQTKVRDSVKKIVDKIKD